MSEKTETRGRKPKRFEIDEIKRIYKHTHNYHETARIYNKTHNEKISYCSVFKIIKGLR